MIPRRIELPLPGYALRPWAWSDKGSLVRHANNRNVSRALFDRFPFPYTEEAAEQWLAIATSEGNDVHLAVVCEDEAVGGISAMRGGVACMHSSRTAADTCGKSCVLVMCV